MVGASHGWGGATLVRRRYTGAESFFSIVWTRRRYLRDCAQLYRPRALLSYALLWRWPLVHRCHPQRALPDLVRRVRRRSHPTSASHESGA